MNGEKNSRSVKKAPPRKCERARECFGCCGFLRTSWRTFKEFSADTSIHGIKYLTDKRLPWSEKLFWAVALILSGVAAGYLIVNTFRQWQQTPVIVTLSENFMNVWEIPFPAITICPIGGADPLNKNFIDIKSSVDRPLHGFSHSNNSRINNTIWMNKPYNDSWELFHEIVTEEGFCYTFNSMNYYDLFHEHVVFEAYENLKNTSKAQFTQWLLDDGYLLRDPNVYPRRAGGSGEISGISFDIIRDLNELKDSPIYEKGFKLAFHLPNEVPRMSKRFYRFPLEKIATLIVTPSMIVTENLENYDIKTRKCYYEGEKKLKYFKHYTRSNCQIECSANYTLRKCKCVHHSMPRLRNEKICDSSQQACYHDGKRDTLIHTMEKSLNTSRSIYDLGKMACGCLPACTSLEYDGEISVDELRYFGKIKISRFFRSAVSIFFNHDDFIYSKRSELYSFTDFIANFGGILGLFLGVSILSIVEVIYFIAFRDVSATDDESDNEQNNNGSQEHVDDSSKSF